MRKRKHKKKKVLFALVLFLCCARPRYGILVLKLELQASSVPRACAYVVVACSAGGFWRGEWIYISIGCSGRHLELEKQWRVGAR